MNAKSEKYKEYQHRYYQAHKEQLQEYRRKRYAEHGDEIRAYMRARSRAIKKRRDDLKLLDRLIYPRDCELCGKAIHSSETAYISDGRIVCSGCLPRKEAEKDGGKE